MVNGANEEAYSEISVSIRPDALVTWFADLVQAEANPEYVSINVLQEVPGTGRETGHEGPMQAMLVGRVAMTWPHFVRLANLLPKIVDDYRDRARQAVEVALK